MVTFSSAFEHLLIKSELFSIFGTKLDHFFINFAIENRYNIYSKLKTGYWKYYFNYIPVMLPISYI